eukprot:1387850-Pleurochrysis_carterae.AAC.2
MKRHSTWRNSEHARSSFRENASEYPCACACILRHVSVCVRVRLHVPRRGLERVGEGEGRGAWAAWWKGGWWARAHRDWVVHVPGDAEELGARVVLAAKAGEPLGAASSGRGGRGGLKGGACVWLCGSA